MDREPKKIEDVQVGTVLCDMHDIGKIGYDNLIEGYVLDSRIVLRAPDGKSTTAFWQLLEEWTKDKTGEYFMYSNKFLVVYDDGEDSEEHTVTCWYSYDGRRIGLVHLKLK
jgi:hypothetical protein